MIVTDTEVHIGTNACFIQNLGPDPAFVGGEDVGLRISSGEVVELGYRESPSTIVSDGTSDVRILSR